MRCTPAAAAFAASSCANSTECPVPSDCADCTGRPAASSSVSEALRTDSMLPKNSTSLLARVGPSPGVRVRASHEIWLELALKLNGFESETAVLGKTASPGGQCRL